MRLDGLLLWKPSFRRLRDDAGECPTPTSALDPFKPYIVERLVELPELTSIRLAVELRGRGCPLGIAQLRRYVAQIRPARLRKAYLRIETDPGEQAQVDWGSFGHMRVGTGQRPLSVFSMVMSWSRALFIDFALDQQMETFLRMHRRARSLPRIQGSRRGVDQVHPPFVVLRSVVLLSRRSARAGGGVA